MTDVKAQYQELLDKQDALVRQQNDLTRSQNQIDEAKSDLVRKLILENGILSGSSWDLEIPEDSSRTFCISTHINDLPKEVRNIRTGWHDFFQLTDHIGLYFDDNTVTLSFQPEANITEFISSSKLTIVSATIDHDIKQLQDKLATLQNLKKSFIKKEG